MDSAYYLQIFQNAASKLDQKLFSDEQLEIKVGIWLNSICLKIQKQSWLNPSAAAKPFQESVFFSVWINEDTISQNKLYYNIHALKMRKLIIYTIKSRDFAEAFRSRFKPYQAQWPNVSTVFGPLTLMEGWAEIDDHNLTEQIAGLAGRFLTIHHIIDELLEQRMK